MNNSTLYAIAKSWTVLESELNSTQDILDWVAQRNTQVYVDISKCSLSDCAAWFYDESTGCIRNKDNSFFKIIGISGTWQKKGKIEQPIILQPEIGYLGIICKEFHGVMHFLMQAKIEPGNVNKIQLSPTIQATKSNYTQKHGGTTPPYLEYFEEAASYEIVVDQIQSEQASRFYKKRNRNIIIRIEEDVPVLPSYKWMTLGQIKRLMREDNLVNMDTRTVLSCIPFSKLVMDHKQYQQLQESFSDQQLFVSVFGTEQENVVSDIYHYINNQKMYAENSLAFVPLHTLENWTMREWEVTCSSPYPFKVVYCDIAIEGREVKNWMQPLFEATGIAVFGLICCEDEGGLKFLVRAKPEIGSFDTLELGASIQKEAVLYPGDSETAIDQFFESHLQSGEGIVFDHLLSEEGGRFYREQNRNVLLRIKREALPVLPEGYFLVDYKTLNELVQVNNTLNIQLRNLLSLLEA